MKLWKISQDVNNDYDTYDSAVVAAETEEEARSIHPQSSVMVRPWDRAAQKYGDGPEERLYPNPWDADNSGSWADSPSQVAVQEIGNAVPGTVAGVIVASYNAG